MIIGYQRQAKYLEKVFQKGSWAHAYLFYGPEHVGKTTAALVFTKSLLCEERLGIWGGCGECATCKLEDLRLSGRFLQLAPRTRKEAEENDTTREINIKEVSELRRRLSFASGKSRVVLIQRAEVMSRDAANALLKILEEPGAGTVFIFISSAPRYILATIRSRIVPLRFGFAPDSELRVVKGATDALVELSAGRAGVLVSALQDGKFRENEENLRNAAVEMWTGAVAEAFAAAKKFSDAEGKDKAIILYLLRLLKRDLKGFGGGQVLRLAERTSRAISALASFEATNVNRRLALDIIFLNLQKTRS